MAESTFELQGGYYMDTISNVFEALADYIFSMQVDPVSSPHQAVIRFHNNYGVCILPLAHNQEKTVYEILVLRFSGSGDHDYEIAQYALVPEINWVYTPEDILSVCRQVSLMQKKKSGSVPPGIAA